MKARVFLLSAAAGLACGFLVRPRGPSAADPAMEAGGLRVLETGVGATLPPGSGVDAKWESRLSRYLTAPPPPPAAQGAYGPRAETAALLRMARLPVSAESIAEGIAVLNAMGPSRYSGIIPSIFARWSREAPEAALAAVSGLRDAPTRMALVWKVFETAAAAGDPDLQAKASVLPVGIARSAAFAAIADSVPSHQVEETLRRSLTGKPPPYMAGASFQRDLFTKLAQIDPAAPLRLAEETQDPAWRAGLLQAALLMSMDEKPETFPRLARDPRNVEGLMYHMANKLRYNTADGLEMIATWPEANRERLLRTTFGDAFERLPEGVYRPAMEADNLDVLIKETKRMQGEDGFRSILAESALTRGSRGLDDMATWMVSRHDAAGLEDLTRRAAQAEPFTTAPLARRHAALGGPGSGCRRLRGDPRRG